MAGSASPLENPTHLKCGPIISHGSDGHPHTYPSPSYSDASQMGRARGTASEGVCRQHPVCGRTLPAHVPPNNMCSAERNNTAKQWKSTHTQTINTRMTTVEIWLTYLWVSLLTEASAALHRGHFTLLLICGRRLFFYKKRLLKTFHPVVVWVP